MKILLDTHIALWAAQGSSSLSSVARQYIERSDCDLYVSAAAIWEIAIKHGKGNLMLHPRDAKAAFRSCKFLELAVTSDHAEEVAALPQYPDHADPFDRLMVAQALRESMFLLTADAKLWRYHPSLILRA